MQCESFIFYELSNVWQVNDTMCRDIHSCNPDNLAP